MIVLVIAVLGSTITAALIIWLANHNAPSHAPTPTATPAFQDILADDQSGWIKISGQFFFTNGQYHILNNLGSQGALALYGDESPRYQYTDFHLTITMSEISRSSANNADYYGVIFRATTDTTTGEEAHFYLFDVSPSSGSYIFYRFDKNSDQKDSTPYQQLLSGSAPGLLSDLGKSNTITIDAKGRSFTFYVNSKPIGPAFTDPSKSALTSGQVGLFVEDQGTEVAFSKMHIDRL